MRIALLYHGFELSVFMLNLGRFLQALGHEVFVLNPPLHIKHVARKLGVPTLYCSNKREDILKCLTQNNIERIVLWNGLNHKGLLDAARMLNIKTYFAENGYFPNTLQLQEGGVNFSAGFDFSSSDTLLNTSFKRAKIDKVLIRDFKPLELKFPTLLYLIEQIKRLFKTGSLKTFKTLKQIVLGKIAHIRFKYLSHKDLPEISEIKPFVLVVLQVNSDTQILHNSPYKNMYEVLDTLVPALIKNGYKVLIKEHPDELELTNYNRYADNEKVFVVGRYPLDKLVQESDFVALVNSSVGLQALSKGKKVLLLGNAFYENIDGVVKCNLKTDSIQEALEKIKKAKYNPELIHRLTKHFKEEIFIRGNWRKPTVEFLSAVAERILV